MTFRFAEPKRRIKGTSRDTQENGETKKCCFSVPKRRMLFFSSNLQSSEKIVCLTWSWHWRCGCRCGQWCCHWCHRCRNGRHWRWQPSPGRWFKDKKNISRNTDSLNLSAFQVEQKQYPNKNNMENALRLKSTC